MARMARGVRVRAAVAAVLCSVCGCLDSPPARVGGEDAGGRDAATLDASALDGWTRRAPIIVEGLGQTIDDVPVLVRLAPEVVSDLDLDDDLRDVRFVDGETLLLLPYDILAPASDGTANLYVRLPLLPPDGITFDVVGGNPAASDAESPLEVWQGFSGVWHLDERNGGAFDDETGPHPAVLNGTASDVSGRVGNAVELKGTQNLEVTDHPGVSPPDAVTAEITIRPDQIDSSDRYGISNGTFELQVCSAGGGEATFLVWDTESGGQAVVGATAALAEWVYLAGTYDGTNLAIYQDGILKLSVDVSVELDDTSANLFIGKRVVGDVDEVRISPVGRSSAWIQAQQRMFADDGLVTVGSVADIP